MLIFESNLTLVKPKTYIFSRTRTQPMGTEPFVSTFSPKGGDSAAIPGAEQRHITERDHHQQGSGERVERHWQSGKAWQKPTN